MTSKTKMRAIIVGALGCAMATMAVAQGSFIKKKAAAPAQTPASAPAKPPPAAAPRPAPIPVTPAPKATPTPTKQFATVPAKGKGTAGSPYDILGAFEAARDGKPLPRSRVYSQRLLALMVAADKAARARGDQMGALDYDPLCGCQDTDGLYWTFGIASQTAATAIAKATINHNKVLTYRLVKQANGWRIDDVSSPEVPSLVASLNPKGGRSMAAALPVRVPWPDANELTLLSELVRCRAEITSHFDRATPDQQWSGTPDFRLYHVPATVNFPFIPVHSITISRAMGYVFLNSWANMPAEDARSMAIRILSGYKLNKQNQPNWKLKTQGDVAENTPLWLQGIRKGDKYQILSAQGTAKWDYSQGFSEVKVYDKGVIGITCLLPDSTVVR